MRKNKEWEASFDGSKGNLFFEQVLHRIYYCISYEKRKALNAKIEITVHECTYCRLGFVLASLI